jgi:hypothetical protein
MPHEAATMAAWTRDDLAKKKITPEAAEKIFSELSTPMEQRSTEDTRTDEQKAQDQAFPPAGPTDYTIRLSRPGQDVTITPEIKAFDQSARAWMSAAGLPRELGNSLANTIDRVALHTADMDLSQLASYKKTERAKLAAVFGTELQAKFDAAEAMLADTDKTQPGVVAFLLEMPGFATPRWSARC